MSGGYFIAYLSVLAVDSSRRFAIRYLKTTLFGLTGCSPDYVMLIVGGNAGLIGMSKVGASRTHVCDTATDYDCVNLGASRCRTGLARPSNSASCGNLLYGVSGLIPLRPLLSRYA